MYEAERNEGETFNDYVDRIGPERFTDEVKDLSLPVEFSVETMNTFIDWSQQRALPGRPRRRRVRGVMTLARRQSSATPPSGSTASRSPARSRRRRASCSTSRRGSRRSGFDVFTLDTGVLFAETHETWARLRAPLRHEHRGAAAASARPPVGDRPRRVLRGAQGRPAARAPRRRRRVGHRRAPRPGGDAGEHRGDLLGRRSTACSRSRRSRAGRRRTSGATSTSAGCRTTSCTTAATPRSAACRARSRARAATGRWSGTGKLECGLHAA